MGESEHKSGPAFGFWEVAILILIIGFVVAVAIPNRGGGSHTSPANSCINNMKQIDGAINEWALEKGKTNGTVVTANDITNYIKLNQYGKIPPCPSGGKYTYGKVGDTPQISCSLSTAIPPHALP
jgi:competence protein ComGC